MDEIIRMEAMGRVEPQRGLGAAGSVTTAPDLQTSSSLHAFLRPVSDFKQCSPLLCLLSVSSAALFSINDSHTAAHFYNFIINER
ncbi:hypothetical protein BDDG_11826 [Blastomyces dermatitidis ATCC 18188]|uniref:Uncharacterized protein n=1 Tax=Ajellomyces dermatitidis (strain ATCC 18188 / CBS 674.68) TaxID=653446 RepID=A0A0J9ENZ1_AJEDA|nr:hypothetical protein BDDG_11826 [Blastomyces dermatitidis ATCC 18188]